MTNPTPPLTAGTVIDIIVYDLTGNIPTWNGGEIFVKSFCRSSITPDIDAVEAYAAQQNAELVAENKKLKAENKTVHDYKEAVWVKYREFEHENTRLQAEIERLKQQLEWQPIETAPKDGTLVWISGPKYNNRSLGAYLTDKYIEENNIYSHNDDPLIAGWYEYETGHPEFDEYWNAVEDPTLWQPVPAFPQPPKEAT